jgi:hypothetical protein
LCKQCSVRFVKQYRSVKWQKELFQEYVFGKQTLKQLADKYGKSPKTIKNYLDQYQEVRSASFIARPIVIGIDCSFFGRGYGIIVARCPGLKQNLYWKEITTENKDVYAEARLYLEAASFNIQAVVLDAKHGIRDVFSDLVVQVCQYHQQQIIGRYLTARPKSEAGLELRLLAGSLTKIDEKLFTELLKNWHEKWQEFLIERTYKPDGKHWWYTHKRIRAAYRSLIKNLPYLFSYQRYPEMYIPNTNNSLEGYFSKLKKLLNNHNGLKRWRRYRLIEAILND